MSITLNESPFEDDDDWERIAEAEAALSGEFPEEWDDDEAWEDLTDDEEWR